jgi:hypothetical protein
MNLKEKYSACVVHLLNKGVLSICAEFNGGGDSGWVDIITFFDENDKHVNMSEELIKETWSTLENFCCDLILNHANTVADIVNNDGGTATLNLNLLDMRYSLDVTEYYTQSNKYDFQGTVKEYLDGTS